MTLLTYQVFKTVADIGSFHKAAEVLGLTPSAISHTIANMEAELGFSVLTRSKSGIKLTNYGEHLLPYVNAVLNSDESLQQMISELNGLKTGRVKLGVFPSVCSNWIPDIISTFNERNASVIIEVFQGTYSDVADWLKNGVVDIGILSVTSAKDVPILPLYRDRLLCVMPKGLCGKSSGSVVNVEELRDYQFVTQRENTDVDIQNFLRENSLKIQSNYHVADDHATLKLVEKGFGICLIPELIMRDVPYDVDCYELEPAEARIIGISAMNPTLMAPAVRSLYNHIVEMFKSI